MKACLKIEFAEPPSLTQFVKLLEAVGAAYPGAMVNQPDVTEMGALFIVIEVPE